MDTVLHVKGPPKLNTMLKETKCAECPFYRVPPVRYLCRTGSLQPPGHSTKVSVLRDIIKGVGGGGGGNV